MEFGLSKRHRDIISGIFSRYPEVRKVLVYGSRAKGNYRPGSDIDMTVVERSDISTQTLLRMVNDFDESMLPFTVDLSVFSRLTNPDLISHIERCGKCIYERSAE